MAKHVILESYSFTPATRTIVVYGKWIRREQLLLITNVTKNTVIYNFSDPSLGVSAHTTTISQQGPTTQSNEITTVVVSYDTTSHSATDKLAILVEETYESILPAETLMDPVGKMRVSTPQSLIDTDFEYGQQQTKWESIAMVNNRPTAFYDPSASGTQWPTTTGTVTQSTTAVSGTGTAFHAGMIGSRFVHMDGTDVGTIIAVGSAGGLTVTGSYSLATTSPYTIYGVPYKSTGSPSTTTDSSILSASTTTITLTLNTGAANLYVGQPIFVTNSLDQTNVDGWWVIDTISTGSFGVTSQDSFTFKVLNTPSVTSLFDPTKTQIFPGQWYTGANIPLAASSAVVVNSSTLVTVTTLAAHGLNVGQHIHINRTTVPTNVVVQNGTYVIASTPTNSTFTYAISSGTAGTATLNAGQYGTLYPRSQGYVIHRPFDGGVQFANQTAYHGLQMIRQTRRYFRYQSGKSIQFSTGSLLKPTLAVESITNTVNLTTATITTKYPHGLIYSATGTNVQIKVRGAADVAGIAFPGTASQSGTTITGVGTNFTASMVGQTFVFTDGTSAGAIASLSTTTSLTVSASQTVASQKYYVQSTAYNGTYTITAASTSANTITYTTGAIPSNSATSAVPVDGLGGVNVSVDSWYGGKNRVGLFDHQNGFFFEYDGQTLYAVRRSSTQQIPGTFSVTQGSQSVVATAATGGVANHLKPGDQIVIRGGSYTVGAITSATQMYIYPEYRGATPLNSSYAAQTQTGVTISKTIDTRIPQSAWNIDRCDGTGHSGYTVDLTRMQMFYIDYSWYGAGAIRFGFKNARGEVIYCHRIVNNNVNTEAYMRSGNIAARYETNTLAPTTWLTPAAAIGTGSGITINVADASQFPPLGIVVLTNQAATGAVIEYANYTKTSDSVLTLGTRGLSQGGGSGTGTAFASTAIIPVKVELYLPSVASTLSHWGSSVIMDGRYDDDKSLVFSAGMNNISTVTTRQQYPLVSLRIAPSADSGYGGALGAKEVINRMQLILRQMDAFTTANSFAVDLWLNASIATAIYPASTGTTEAQTLLSLGTILVGGITPVVGAQIYGPGIAPGTFFTAWTSNSNNAMNIFPLATRGGNYYINNNIYQPVGGSSLSQRILHATSDRLIPGTGEKIFTFFTNSAGVTQQDLASVRDLATSIVGGASNNYQTPGYYNKYPDGPDVITMVATPIGAVTSATIIARLSWTEAQA